MYDNKYCSFIDALEESARIIGDDGFLIDGDGVTWDIFTLMDYTADAYMIKDDDDNYAYWCVGFDGSIGFTRDDGYHVLWLFKPED